MNHRHDVATRRLALTGMLFALCCVFSFLESLLTGALGLPPGVKPGLANVVVMFTLFFIGWKQAAALVLLKAAFGVLTRGMTAGFLSLCGGLLSFALLCMLLYLSKNSLSRGFLSVCGALAHNFGQLLGLWLWMKSTAVFYYLPMLVLAAVACGILSAWVLKFISPYLKPVLDSRDTINSNTENEYQIKQK